MTQQIINVGAAPNDGQGDPIRTAFTKCNNNFTELYDREQTTPPPTLTGSVGDVAGMYAYDENFYYYCFQNFDGSSQIWNKVPNTGNAQVTILTATGNIVSAGNISAVNFIGNGSLLTNVVAGAPNTVVNGNSNITISLNGNIDMSVNGVPEIVTVTDRAPIAAGGVAPSLLVDGYIRSNFNITGVNFRAVSNGSANTGQFIATGNMSANNIFASGFMSTGNLRVNGNVNTPLDLSNSLTVGGTLTLIGNVTSNVTVEQNVSAQNINSQGNVSAGGYFIGDGGFLSNVTAVSNVAATQIANGSSIISIDGSGGNALITVGGIANVVVVTTQGANVNGYITSTANIDGANINSSGRIVAVANVTGGNLTTGGRVVASGNVNALNVNTDQQVVATGNITGGNISTTGRITATGNITGGNITGNLLTGTLFTAFQPNINSIGVLNSLDVIGNISVANSATVINTAVFTTGNITGSNLVTGGNIISSGFASVNGNVTVGNLITGGQVVATANVSGANLNTNGRVLATGNVTGGNLTTGGQVVTTGNISGANLNITGNIVDTASMTLISVGNITLNPTSSGVIVINADLRNGQANGVGNIGDAGNYFNTVFAKATSAQYADLAECYLADAEYTPGTVLSFGGTAEVTVSTQDHDPLIVGVVSTQPAYQMNSGLDGEHVVTVALIGRVPCRVQGPVTRGAMMVSAGNGLARAEKSPAMGTVIGKALEDFNGDQGTIEIVVGRL